MIRLEQNPLISPADVKPSRPDFDVFGAFNAGAIRVGNEIVLLLRVAEGPPMEPSSVHAPIWNAEIGEVGILSVATTDNGLHVEDERVFRYEGEFYLTSISHLRLARSTDGIHFSIEDEPALFPASPLEAFGIEDPRITEVDGEFVITYKAVSRHGVATALARTRDFREFVREGVVFCPENLDVVIFPHRIDGRHVALTRPVGVHQGAPSIWLARSPDLLHWGGHEPVMAPRVGCWDSARIGASCVPIKTDDGWLVIYHGADADTCYRAGVALLDADDPSTVLARSSNAFLEPVESYECEGFFGGVVFPCGHVLIDDGSVIIYYGAADESTCGVRTTLDDLMACLG